MGQNGFGIHIRSRNPGHHQFDTLASFLVGYANAGALRHTGAATGYGFHFVGIDVEAGNNDHVLFAVHNLEEALGIKHANVACPEIPIRSKR